MAEYLIQSESLTAIADEVRELSGTTEPMSLEAMATCVGNANTEISAQETIISEQDAKIAAIVEALAGKASGGSTNEPNLINFVIEVGVNQPTIYNVQAEENMNWGMWIHSIYNSQLWSPWLGNNYGFFISSGSVIYTIGGFDIPLLLNNNTVMSTDLIISGETYIAVKEV